MKKDLEKLRTRCFVFSRIVGYISPVNIWNKGKKEEWKNRKRFKLDKYGL